MSLLPADTLGTQQVYDIVRLGEIRYPFPARPGGQRQSGLGLDAQREVAASFLRARGHEGVAEIESGKGAEA